MKALITYTVKLAINTRKYLNGDEKCNKKTENIEQKLKILHESKNILFRVRTYL